MKRIFTLSLLALFVALGANAQAKKSWDFTKWSSTTLSNLEADAAAGGRASATWTSLEKAADGTSTENDNRAYWLNNATAGAFSANGAAIPELEGIELASGTGTRWLAVAHDIPSTSLGEYAGSKYLWMGGKDKSIIIKDVKPGAIIEADVESHKPAEGRGINLVVNGSNLEFLEGTATPTTLTHCKWQVPTEGIETETVDVTIKNTNGCHIYRIDIDGGDDPTEEAKKVAYIHEGSDLDSDFAYIALTSSGAIEATAIDINSEAISREALLEYDVMVIAPSVTFLKYNEVFSGTVFFMPVINLSSTLYTLANSAKLVTSADGTMTIPAEYEESELFTDVAIDEGVLDLGIDSYTALEYDEPFNEDKIYAKSGDNVAIHVHNAARNAYMYIPGEITQSEVAMTLMPNAVAMIAPTKRALAKTANPVITTVQSDGMTTVSITCTTPGATVLYKEAGSEDWYAYNNPLEVTHDLTIVSMAFAEGYDDSDEVTADVTIATQAAAPTISVDKQSGKSVVTISGEGTIYYNYANETAVAASAEYSTPLELTRPRTVTAFVVAEGKLQSEAVSVDVDVEGVLLRDSKVSSFVADKALYHDPMEGSGSYSSKVAYYFSWNKSGQSCYTDEVDHTEIVKDSEGNDSTVYFYKMGPEEIFPNDTIAGAADYEWVIASCGQVVNWSSDAPMTGMVGDEGGRYPGTVDDAGCISKANITFGKVSGVATANIRSQKKFVGPFDVEVYVGNGNSSSQPTAEIQISKDGVTWEKLADCNIWPIRRCYMRTVASYNGTDEVYVKLQNTGKTQSAMVYEINILVNTEENASAITNLTNPKPQNLTNAIYNLAGQKVSADYKGIVIKNGKKVMVK